MTTVTTAVVLAVASTGCGDDSDDLPPPPATGTAVSAPTRSSTLSARDAEAVPEILAAFDDYMNAYIELATAGVPGGTEETQDRLEEVPVSSDARAGLAFDLLNGNYRAGHVNDGTIDWAAEVVGIDWENTFRANPEVEVPEATLRVCFDETQWITTDKETGDVVEGPGARYLSTVLVTWRDQDPTRSELEPRWEVTVREDGEAPC